MPYGPNLALGPGLGLAVWPWLSSGPGPSLAVSRSGTWCWPTCGAGLGVALAPGPVLALAQLWVWPLARVLPWPGFGPGSYSLPHPRRHLPSYPASVSRGHDLPRRQPKLKPTALQPNTAQLARARLSTATQARVMANHSCSWLALAGQYLFSTTARERLKVMIFLSTGFFRSQLPKRNSRCRIRLSMLM